MARLGVPVGGRVRKLRAVEDPSAPIPEEIASELGGIIGQERCSRNARPQKDGDGAARCPLCSQNAHDQNVLVPCAQLRATLAAPLERDEEDRKALARAHGTSWRASGWAGEKAARSGRAISPHP